MGAKDKGGYGLIGDDNRVTKTTHRVSWISTYGDIPDGMFVCHTCDNPPCCNPLHLFLGNAKDNVQDMVSKGRCNPATKEKHGAHKLTEETARLIRSEYLEGNTSHAKLASKYGVGASTIRYLLQGKTWK